MANARRRKIDSTTHDLESRLVETVQRYDLIFKATNDVLYELDLVSGTVIWNDTLYNEYGFKPSQKILRLEWWTTRIHPDDALRLERELSEWLESGNDTWQSEYRFQVADESYIDVRDRGVVLRADDGTPLRIIGSFLDVTRQRQLERAKDEFVSLVSHQLRTPLTGIRIYSDMLARGMFGELDEKQHQYAEYISEASVQLIKQVEDIIHISRIELGQTPPRPFLVDSNTLIKECIDAMREQAHEKRATLVFQPDPTIREISIDASIFRQVVTHLITNALRYVRPKKSRITIVFKQETEGYVLSIKDNGIGIPKEIQPNIFSRFYRSSNMMNITEQGTGLSLYLVHLLADIAGCKVWFKSAKTGSTFYFQIPTEGMRKLV